MRSQITPNLFPAALLLALGASSATADQGHFWNWTQGTVREVDAAQRILTLEESAANQPARISWNRKTRWFSHAADPDRTGRPGSGSLVQGQPVRVLYKKEGNHLLAVRILVEPQHPGSEFKAGSGPKPPAEH
jgi:hypothetical protein